MASVNGVIFQSFQWYLPPDGSLWGQLAADAQELANAGFTAVWFPPAYKGQNQFDVGYGIYDLFDLGEFQQKGTRRTKYGTREQLLAAVTAVQAAGMQAYADVVFNHKDGADQVERVRAQIVEWDDRNQPRSEWHEIGAWTRFTFPGRGATHSSMYWHADHFDALSFNADTNNSSRLYRLKDKQFETEVSYEHGNYDYLMACDLDTRHPQVDGELRWWGRWIVDTTGVNGFRIDAVKHIRSSFFRDWLNHLRVHFGGESMEMLGGTKKIN